MPGRLNGSTVFPMGSGLVDAVEENEGSCPSEVGELGRKDFDPALVGLVVDGAEIDMDGAALVWVLSWVIGTAGFPVRLLRPARDR